MKYINIDMESHVLVILQLYEITCQIHIKEYKITNEA